MNSWESNYNFLFGNRILYRNLKILIRQIETQLPDFRKSSKVEYVELIEIKRCLDC